MVMQKKEDSFTIAEKRFNSMLKGVANKRMEKAMELLAV